jgi:lipopolysaccharide export LptBFGC system permease protein LptF
MKRLHRYLLLDLGQNVLVTLAAIIATFFVVALALVLGTSRIAGVPFGVIVRMTGYVAISNLHLTLPLTILTSCIFCYGRLRADREYTAARVSGIHPYRILLPALFVGGLTTLALAWLQGDVMPAAHFNQKKALIQEVFVHLEDILKKKEKSYIDDDWSAVWNGIEQDANGHIILRDLKFMLFDRKPEKKLSRIISADWAKPTFDRRSYRLTMQLKKVVLRNVVDGEESLASSAEALTLPLNLNALARDTKTKRLSDMSYEELLTRVKRLEDAIENGSTDGPKKERERIRETYSEFHSRGAFAGSGILFALFGAILGLRRGTSNRATVFLLGFLVVILGYYPLMMVGTTLGNQGALPPAAALWIGNAVLLALITFDARRLLKS